MHFVKSLFILTLGLMSTSAQAKKICVYDPGGETGPYYQMVDELSIKVKGSDSEFEPKVYTDEATAVRDFRAKSCDGVLATGIRLQNFNNFPSTIEAIGALPSYDLLEQLLNVVTKSAGASKLLVSNDNETVGIVPIGAAYLFVRDRNVDTVGELSGLRIGAFDYDKPSKNMVKRVGATLVPVDLGSLGPKFNNGEVDAVYVSAPAYEAFELEKGLASKGGIVKLPLAQATLQLVVRPSAFPEGFGAQSRNYFLSKFSLAKKLVTDAEAKIPSRYWINLPKSSLPGFDDLFQASRLALLKEGAYHKKMLNVMFRLRCKSDSSRSECAENKE